MEDERFSRLIPMIGEEGLWRLQNARVVLFGLGGVGGACMEALVRGGVGTLVLIDGDRVEKSNTNRQAIAYEHTLGMRKTDAAAQLARSMNPACRLELFDRFILPEDATGLLDGIASTRRIDYIIDCIDTVGTKIAVAEWAEHHATPFVGCAGTARKFDATRFEFANIHDTAVCPLCRVLRREARKKGLQRMEMLYSQEEPHASAYPHDEGALGTMSYVPPVAGMLLAGRVLQAISCDAPE